MLAKFFSYPTENGTFQSEFVSQTDKIVSYEYNKKRIGTGSFTLILPTTDYFCKHIAENMLIEIDGDWLEIRNISRNETQITVTGTDLNGWTDYRITAFGKTQVAGADGYDVIKGSTGECINHYIQNNMTAPVDSARKFPRLIITQTAQGKTDDRYMARLKVLTEVIGNLCVNSTIGYEITANVNQNSFEFKTFAGTDRSIEQTDRTAVIFSQKRNNLLSATYERGNTDLLNAIYATGADVTQTVYRTSDIPTGTLRKETAIDVSVETVADIKDYALAQVTGNIATNSYTLDVAAVADYGIKYNLGDYVTVKDTLTGKTWTAQIEEIKKSKSQTENKIELVLGDTKMKLLNKIQNTVTLNNNSEVNKSYNSMSDIAAEIKENANKFAELTANAMGFYQTEEKQEDGSVIYYQHDKPLLADSTVIWKKSLDSIAVSKDGGKTWKGLDKDGNAVLQVISAVGIIADYIKAGTLSGVKVIANTGSVAGWTMDNGVLVSDDGSLKIDSKSNTIDVYSGDNKLMSLNKSGIKFWRNDTE
ncbi:MAG: hypothetical protein PUG48_04025, partial [Clostridia bacterium]|nr:hypothetical protein [Clostridia bacterium]